MKLFFVRSIIRKTFEKTKKKKFYLENLFLNLIKFENLKFLFFEKNFLFFVLLVMFDKQSEFVDLSYIEKIAIYHFFFSSRKNGNE